MQSTNGAPIGCLLSIGTNGTNGTNRQIVYARPSGGNICSLQMERRSAASFSIGAIGTNGTNRQIVYARPSGVNICSLQIEHRSAASFSIGAIGTNGSIGEGFLTIGICLCVLDMCDNQGVDVCLGIVVSRKLKIIRK